MLMRFARFEQQLKWIALALGILSTIAIIRDWYPYTMFIALPFCLIWAYCAWRTASAFWNVSSTSSAFRLSQRIMSRSHSRHGSFSG